MVEFTDLLYAGLLLLSVGLGFVVRGIRAGLPRQLVSAVAGAGMVTVLCGSFGLHSLVIVVGNIFIVLALSPSVCHIASFAWCFGYLLFFRTTQYFGLPEVPSYADATQLLTTLKLVGLAFEISDSHKNKKKLLKEDGNEATKLECEYRNINPSALDMLLYSYCYIGLLTGPYYKYRTYIDMINNKNADKIEISSHLVVRLKWLPLISVLYILMSSLYPTEYTRSSEIFEQPVWYRIWYLCPMFIVFRLRLYWAWLLAECMCISSTLGAYPKSSKTQNGLGPTDLQALKYSEKEDPGSIEYDFTTVDSLDIYLIETVPTFRGTMKVWNMTVQYWLAHHVYRRFPVKHLRTLATLVTSAYWHGIHPGYYLAFLSMACSMAAESSMRAAFRQGAAPDKQKLFDWLWWIVHVRTYEYMSVSFLLLSWNEIITFWKSIYFSGHCTILFFIIFGQTVCYFKRQRKSDVNCNEKSQNGKLI